MKTRDFSYHLPEELIAQHPAVRRDASRMMVVHRREQRWEHRGVRDLPDFLAAGDLLVLNNTQVIPARLFGHKPVTGGRVELLFLEEMEPGIWDVLLKASRRPRPGSRMLLGSKGHAEAEMIRDGEKGRATIRVHSTRSILDILNEEGLPPLPPYIRRESPESEDRSRYQTLYASRPGAVAAPTAGLHFTHELFKRLEDKGVNRTEITLHVGLGTFRPVTCERIEDHTMHEERYEIGGDAADAIRDTRQRGGRIVAVGSTSVRTLETVAAQHGEIRAGSGRSSIFIHPPYAFRMVDAMLTNFHLPESTLLMMVSALAGHDLIRSAYEEAVREKYRFFSYGDCMLIL